MILPLHGKEFLHLTVSTFLHTSVSSFLHSSVRTFLHDPVNIFLVSAKKTGVIGLILPRAVVFDSEVWNS